MDVFLFCLYKTSIRLLINKITFKKIVSNRFIGFFFVYSTIAFPFVGIQVMSGMGGSTCCFGFME